MQFAYSLGILLYYGLIHCVALWNPKAKSWIRGRKSWSHRLQEQVSDWPADEKSVWVHCASLGEFEQGRPLIEKLKAQNPEIRIILTFFSPSGYEIRKDYPLADLICYLPIDLPGAARKFVSLIRPDLVVFVKYEFWFNYLSVLRKQKIPHILIAGLFRPGQHFFSWYGGWFRKALKGFSHFFVQDQVSAQLLESVNVLDVKVVGDPRIDRVVTLVNSAPVFPEIDRFIQGRKALIVGSSWGPDEALLIPFFSKHLPKDWVMIVAPHDISKTHLNQIDEQITVPYFKYSEGITDEKSTRLLLIDNIGMLSGLYRYGTLAYIGGGFGEGIHNTLEPLAFGLPVIFGPRYSKFREARDMIKGGGAKAIHDLEQLEKAFKEFSNAALYSETTQLTQAYVNKNQGASQKIYSWIDSELKTE